MSKSKKLRLSHPFEGFNLYRYHDGSIRPRKTGLTSARVKTDPAFAVTLFKAHAFSVAAAWAGRVSRALKPVSAKYRIKGVYKRLLGHLVIGIGRAPVASHETAQSLIPGFECNRFSFLQQTAHQLFRITYTGDNQITAALPPMLPALDINFPTGATHCKLNLLLAIVNWQTGEKQMHLHDDNVFYRINHVPTNQIEITLTQPASGTYFVLAVIGIQYFITSIDEQELYPFNKAKTDTLDILACRLLLPTPNS